jgi:pimeloyl-ACP methyl ester carboxylesterase
MSSLAKSVCRGPSRCGRSHALGQGSRARPLPEPIDRLCAAGLSEPRGRIPPTRLIEPVVCSTRVLRHGARLITVLAISTRRVISPCECVAQDRVSDSREGHGWTVLAAIKGDPALSGVPPEHLKFYERVPGSKIAVIDGAGHSPMVEKPAKTLELIRQFLDTVPDRCGAKVRTRSERSGHAESVGSGSI